MPDAIGTIEHAATGGSVREEELTIVLPTANAFPQSINAEAE